MANTDILQAPVNHKIYKCYANTERTISPQIPFWLSIFSSCCWALTIFTTSSCLCTKHFNCVLYTASTKQFSTWVNGTIDVQDCIYEGWSIASLYSMCFLKFATSCVTVLAIRLYHTPIPKSISQFTSPLVIIISKWKPGAHISNVNYHLKGGWNWWHKSLNKIGPNQLLLCI